MALRRKATSSSQTSSNNRAGRCYILLPLCATSFVWPWMERNYNNCCFYWANCKKAKFWKDKLQRCCCYFTEGSLHRAMSFGFCKAFLKACCLKSCKIFAISCCSCCTSLSQLLSLCVCVCLRSVRWSFRLFYVLENCLICSCNFLLIWLQGLTCC